MNASDTDHVRAENGLASSSYSEIDSNAKTSSLDTHKHSDSYRDRSRRHRHDYDRHHHRHHHRHSDRERREHSHHRHRHHRDRNEEQSRHSHHSTRPTDSDTVSGPALQRDSWMLSGTDDDHDLFSAMGKSVSKPQGSKKPEPDELSVSARELNPFLTSQTQPAPQEDQPPKSSPHYGGPGYKWRLMKLQRTYEMADQRGVPVEEVAMERYGSMDAFNEARAERQFVEDRDVSPKHSRHTSMESRAGFRRPGAPSPAATTTARSTPPSSSLSKPGTASIPHVLPTNTAKSSPASPLSVDALNKMEANVLRAELMGRPEAAKLRAELEAARTSQNNAIPSTRVEMVPVVDGFGRMYDIGSSSNSHDPNTGAARPSKRSKMEDEGQETLSELVREERLAAGRADQKQADAMLAHQIMADQGFENDLNYMDEEATRFARKRMRDDALKRQFAVQGTYSKLT